MRTGLATVIVTLLIGAAVSADQDDSRPLNAPLPTQPKLIIRSEELFPLTRPTRLGILTLVQPQTNGEVIRVSIPIGELASRAAHAVSEASRRRAERKINQHIARELQEFTSPKPGK